MNSRCELCPDHNVRCVPSDGPRVSNILFIGEAPGRDEDLGGRPFIGQAGYEFNNLYLPKAGLHRDNVRITNAVHCRPLNNKKPSDKLIACCTAHHLKAELEEARHEIIVPMGATACSLFENVSLAKHHGYPLTRDLFGSTYTIFPVYHPAAGLHSSNLMQPLVEDFKRLNQFLHGRLFVQQDHFAGKEIYREITGNSVGPILRSTNTPQPVAIDTESTGTGLWSIQFSVKAGTGYLIRPDDRAACTTLADHANLHGYTMHYSTEDWDQLRKVGVHLDPNLCYDTIQAAFVDGTLAGGAGGGEEQAGGQWGSLSLKALAWRLCGMEMRTFADVVMGPSRAAVINWLESGIDYLLKFPQPKYLKTKVNYKPHPAMSLLVRLQRHTASSPDYDPWARWADAGEKDDPGVLEGMGLVMCEFGPMPAFGIDRAPYADALRYACMDSDATYRLRVQLESLALSTELNRFIATQDVSDYKDLNL